MLRLIKLCIQSRDDQICYYLLFVFCNRFQGKLTKRSEIEHPPVPTPK
jgi:hypothetical protein